MELTEYELTHFHGGNGFAMVEDIDKEYARVCRLGTPITQAFLAAKSQLSVVTMSKGVDKEKKQLPPEPWTLAYSSRMDEGFMPELAKVRAGIKQGKLKVEASHIVEAND